MAQLNLYFNFDGDCRQAFEFYSRAFGKEISYIGTFGEMPAEEGAPELSSEDKARIMHVSLPISEGTVLMGSDVLNCYSQCVKGNNVSASINATSKEEADRLFSALSENGQITMPLADTFWGAYFGMFVDQFGINWMVNFDYNPM